MTRAKRQPADRELAVLVDGPWRLRWYWRDELEAIQVAARRYPPEHPSGQHQSYRPTAQFQPHPGLEDRSGRVWRYQPEVTT